VVLGEREWECLEVMKPLAIQYEIELLWMARLEEEVCRT